MGRRPSDNEKIAAGREAAAAWASAGWSVELRYDPVGGRAALGTGLVGADLAGAGGLDGEAELLLERAGDGATDRVMLPVRQETGWRPVASGDDPRGGRPRTSPAVTGEDKQDGEVT
jgi:hypothetical protein